MIIRYRHSFWQEFRQTHRVVDRVLFDKEARFDLDFPSPLFGYGWMETAIWDIVWNQARPK